MSRLPSFGKPLKGDGTLSARFTGPLQDAITSAIVDGGLELSNVNITGGTIDGTTIGSNQPGGGSFTTLQTGNPSGQGYQVCFYGEIVGDSACWDPVQGAWNINGSLYVRDFSTLGNLRFSGNGITAINTNGNVNVTPNGLGVLNITGGVTQTTTSGNISFNTASGNYSLNSGGTSILNSGNSTILNTSNGDITLNTGENIPSFVIELISTGTTSVVVTTSSANSFIQGLYIVISGTNSTPIIDGIYMINSINSFTSFTISVNTPVTVTGNTGNVRQRNIISLNATDVLYVNSDSIINGNLIVSGNTTYLETTSTSMDDPVITLGGVIPPTVSDIKDRGIQYRYFSGNSAHEGFFGRSTATGCFTYIPDATNNNEVFTGAPGCASFGQINGTGLNLQGGSLTNIGTFNSCNITCSSTMYISATDGINVTAPYIDINSSSTQFSSSSISIGAGAIAGEDHGVLFNYINSGGSPVSGFFGWRDFTQCFSIYSTANVVNNVVTSGTLGNLCAAGVNSSSISNSGNITTNTLTVTNGITGLLTIEHLSVAGTGSINPSPGINVTWISVTSSGTATGILSAPVQDGFQKYIFIESLVSGGIYQLTAPTGTLLDPGTETTGSKYLNFEHIGQSVYLIYNSNKLSYYIVNGGVCISLA